MAPPSPVAATLRPGLVPRQMTIDGKPRLLGISKRGNKYLRKLLVHGARAALPSLSSSPTPIGQWLQGLMARARKNTVVVALANKLARIVRFRLGNRRRLWGSRVVSEFQIVGYDPEHNIYPTDPG